MGYRKLKGVWKWIFIPQRLQQIFLVTQALGQALLCLFPAHVFHRFNALHLLDVLLDFLTLARHHLVFEINADLYLGLQGRGQPVHIEHERQEDPQYKQGHGHGTD